ncbi:SusD/RagB family nutrient-binding outer membrane lipoprotein [Foetidibacter luteolus]|uniref:SusD/RagB family nutrient-binding outer membrane lipoprotein n=1 Tax=Foetidibacter luteolus TaxID=2608880 RepID=UPI00129C0212|nr:SusD/RagB family nutrient-binding outer membrane lipoprotein [Foetidibacter luteolus]
MKKSFLYMSLWGLLLLGSCTKDFDKINTDPTQASPDQFDANYFLSSSQRNYASGISGYAGPILFQSGWVQIFSMATVNGDYYTNADKYVESSNTNSYVQSSWNNCYRSGSLANEILVNHKDDADWVNINAAATIMKVLNAQYITDIYGDCPYTEAYKAKEGITLPVYDKQQALYTALLSDLDAALTSMDASKPKPTADISSLGGDVAKWKRFGYSLMLRLAMRLTKADAATAKTWAEKAAAGGTLASGEDVYFKNDEGNGYSNPNVSAWLVATDFYQVRWSKTMIDYLKAADDPRLSIVAEVPATGLANNNNQALAGDNTASEQIGQPNGYDLIPASAKNITTAPGYPGTSPADPAITGDVAAAVGKYSRPRKSVYGERSKPLFILTYAESELLLAEAAARGYSVGATASQHYKNAVSGALQALAVYGSTAVISAADADAYATAHPLDVSSTEKSIEMISTQYWATTGLVWNFAESWSNWRRTDYPKLTPVNYTGNFSGGAIPRRQPYPSGESSNNRENYQTAVSGLSGGDNWTSRIWWDK